MGTAMNSTITSGALRKLTPRSAPAQDWEVVESEEKRLPSGLLPMQAALWEKSYYPDGLLLRGQALRQAEAWALRHEAELRDTERDYLIACQSAESCAAREREHNALLRILLAAMAVACMMSFWHWLDGRREAGTYLAARDATQAELLSEAAERAIVETQLAAESAARQKAEEAQAANAAEREHAQRARQLAESRALTAYSEAAQPSDPRLAVLLAMESVRAAQLSGAGGSASDIGFTALERALEQLRVRERQSLRRSLRSPDDTLSLDILTGGTASVRHLVSEQIISLLSPGGWITQAAWSPDGSRILAGGCAGRAAIYDAASGAMLVGLSGHRDLILHVSWSKDGQKVATASRDGSVMLWEARDGARSGALAGHCSGVWNTAWSPDGSHLVTLGLDGDALLWEVRSGRQLYTLEGHPHGVAVAVWSPSGAALASVGAEGQVLLWDVASGSKQSLFGKLRIAQVAWGIDDHFLAASNHDEETYVWDGVDVRLFATGEGKVAILPLEPPESAPSSAEQPPACAENASETADDLLTLACHRAGRNLTRGEWTKYFGAETPYRKTCAELP
jgi:hypothetical protein